MPGALQTSSPRRLRTSYRRRRRQFWIRFASASVGAAFGIVASTWVGERLAAHGYVVGQADLQRFVLLVLGLAAIGWLIAWAVLRFADPPLKEEDQPLV